MAKHVLQFFPHDLKKNYGGAYSYLYNLKNAFTSNEVTLSFLCEILPFEETVVVNTGPHLLRSIAKRLIPNKIIYARRVKRYLKQISKLPFAEKIAGLNLNEYDAIHFHETVDIWRAQELLNNYKGKILLTSHSPKPYHLELLQDVFGLDESGLPQQLYRELEMIDNVAFEKADIVIAPCFEALNTYETLWPGFLGKIESKSKVFVPTGIEAFTPTLTINKVKKELKIPGDAFVVCFNGRHSSVKGYDLLLQAAKKLVSENANIYFIVTGEKDGPPEFVHPQWIETGWTETPENFVSAADLVIVPNRQTYFDLNVLMALSLGKPVALSESGGNKFFKQFNLPSILFFKAESLSALEEVILNAYQKQSALDGNPNSELFKQHFTSAKFAEAYNQFYLSI